MKSQRADGKATKVKRLWKVEKRVVLSQSWQLVGYVEGQMEDAVAVAAEALEREEVWQVRLSSDRGQTHIYIPQWAGV